MVRTVGIGKQNFEKIMANNNFYVDKTKFIKEWWENEDEKEKELFHGVPRDIEEVLATLLQI